MDGKTQKRTKIGQLKRHEGLKVVYLMESTFQILERHEERVVTGGPSDDKQ